MKKCCCYDCGLDYGDPGWVEAVIPDKVWNEISPTGNQGGILCITCISRRLVKKGFKNVPVWICGTEPLRPILCGDREDEVQTFLIRNWEPNLNKVKKGKNETYLYR